MKNSKKRLGYALCILLTCVLFSCKTGKKYDDKIVRDADGKYYHLEYNVGDTYFINEIKVDSAFINAR